MKRILLLVIAIPAVLTACQTVSSRETIAHLRKMKIEVKEERIEGGLEKAMESYQRFLDDTPESALTPAAMRRLADLKIEKEYGYLAAPAVSAFATPERAPKLAVSTAAEAHGETESPADFERRATRTLPARGKTGGSGEAGSEDLERTGAREALGLYTRLMEKYPLYKGNDQVLYQMSRAYEELGQTEEAMEVIERLVRDFPQSPYVDEVRYRRAEFYFVRRRFMDAEAGYKTLVNMGPKSPYYELALYKLGWTFYKQELYEDALQRFIALLDRKVTTGYDFNQTADDQERKRVEDTFRVISQSFSYLQGAESVMGYFDANGKRSYEDLIYSNLGEYYYEKRRYTDAAAAYNAFAKRNPFHRVAPQFHMRVIDIQLAGGFPSVVIEAKKQFAKNYGLQAEYWKHFEPASRPEVLGFLKTNFTDLAQHYHSLYQEPERAKGKEANFREAMHWYEQFLVSFPNDAESPAINYQLADLLLENKSFARAAAEYEKTAYGFPEHQKASAAGYAAIFAYREHLKTIAQEEKAQAKREAVRSSLKFAGTFPLHEKAAIVLGAAADDLYDMKDYEEALEASQKLIKDFPGADGETVKSAWIITAHANYELELYSEAEAAYMKVLALLSTEDKNWHGFIDNLAAAIYKQGEEANAARNYQAAAYHFLRISRMAPLSKIRASAEYDGAAALVQLKKWPEAAAVLTGFRTLFPGHQLQPEVTRQLAFIYREDGRLSLAAGEYEQVEKEFRDEEVRKGALVLAADLHQQSGNKQQAMAVYQRYVGFFPEPVEINLEMRHKIAEILKGENDGKSYLSELQEMVRIEAAAKDGRTPRTRYLAGTAALVLAEKTYDQFRDVRLVMPFEPNLRRKKELMKETTQAFNQLMDYEVGEVTAAATFYLAEIYANFSRSLLDSERPTDLDAPELQEFELAIEEQAYPFEEKAITIHEKNMELISLGIYNLWIDKSLGRLAKFVPVRYDKPEIPTVMVASLENFAFEIEQPVSEAVPETGTKPEAAPEAAATPTSISVVQEVETAVPVTPATTVEAPAAAPQPAINDQKSEPKAAPLKKKVVEKAAPAKPRAKGAKNGKRKK